MERGGGAFDATPQSRDGQKSPVWVGLIRFSDTFYLVVKKHFFYSRL